MVQRLPHFIGKINDAVRFEDIPPTSLFHHFPGFFVDELPGGQKNFDVGIDFFQIQEGFQSVHIRHDHVQNH